MCKRQSGADFLHIVGISEPACSCSHACLFTCTQSFFNAQTMISYMHTIAPNIFGRVMNHVRSHEICISICHTSVILPQVTLNRARQRCLSWMKYPFPVPSPNPKYNTNPQPLDHEQLQQTMHTIPPNVHRANIMYVLCMRSTTYTCPVQHKSCDCLQYWPIWTVYWSGFCTLDNTVTETYCRWIAEYSCSIACRLSLCFHLAMIWCFSQGSCEFYTATQYPPT